MPIYQRYIISNIVSIFFILLFVITGLVWLSQIIKLISLMEQGVSFLDFVNITLLLLPLLLFPILPFAVVLAVGIVYNKFSYEREIIILENIGLSPWNVIKPAIIVSCFVAILGYAVSVYLLPVSTSKLKSKLRYIKDNYASNFIQEKTFTTVSKDVIIYVAEKISASKLNGIVIFDNSNEGKKVIIFSQSGNINLQQNYTSLDLVNGMRQEVEQDTGHLSKMHFKSLSVALSNNPKCHIDSTDPKCLPSSRSKDMNEFFLTELIDPDNNFLDDKKIKLKAEFHQRIIWPLMIIVLPLVFLSVFMQKPYSRRGNSKIIGKAAGISLILVILHFVFHNLASKNILIGIFCYINIGLFSAISYYLLSQDKNIFKNKIF